MGRIAGSVLLRRLLQRARRLALEGKVLEAVSILRQIEESAGTWIDVGERFGTPVTALPPLDLEELGLRLFVLLLASLEYKLMRRIFHRDRFPMFVSRKRFRRYFLLYAAPPDAPENMFLPPVLWASGCSPHFAWGGVGITSRKAGSCYLIDRICWDKAWEKLPPIAQLAGLSLVMEMASRAGGGGDVIDFYCPPEERAMLLDILIWAGIPHEYQPGGGYAWTHMLVKLSDVKKALEKLRERGGGPPQRGGAPQP